MNPEQLASEELTQWREKTMKKELELIKEVAEEEAQIMSSHTVRKMTYKGEVEIERSTEVRGPPCTLSWHLPHSKHHIHVVPTVQGA